MLYFNTRAICIYINVAECDLSTTVRVVQRVVPTQCFAARRMHKSAVNMSCMRCMQATAPPQKAKCTEILSCRIEYASPGRDALPFAVILQTYAFLACKRKRCYEVRLGWFSRARAIMPTCVGVWLDYSIVPIRLLSVTATVHS